MSGFVDLEGIRKIKRGWISIPDGYSDHDSEVIEEHYQQISQLPDEYLNSQLNFFSVVVNNEIHVLGGDDGYNHFKYSNGSWVEVSSLPLPFRTDFSSQVLLLNNEIHYITLNSQDIYHSSHYKFSNGSWELVSTLPYKLSSNPVVLNDEIHIFGGEIQISSGAAASYDHYKYSGGEWVRVTGNPSYMAASAVVLNGEIHIFGSSEYTSYKKAHYKYSNNSWSYVGELPINITRKGYAVVLNGTIYITNGDGYIYKFVDGAWVLVSNINMVGQDGIELLFYILVFNDHICGFFRRYYATNRRYRIYEYVEAQTIIRPHMPLLTYSDKMVRKAWIGDDNGNPLLALNSYKYIKQNNGRLPSASKPNRSLVLNHGNKIYYFNRESDSNNSEISWYEYDGINWVNNGTLIGSGISDFENRFLCIEYNNQIYFFGQSYFYVLVNHSLDRVGLLPDWLPSYTHGDVVIYDNKINVLSDIRHYSWDGTTWAEVSRIPFSFIHGSAVVYNNKIYILGHNNFYSWDGSSWTQLSHQPYTFYNNSAVVYENKIHMFIEKNSGTADTCHYSWNGTQWSTELDIPFIDNFASDRGLAIVYDGKINVLGGDSGSLDDHSNFSYDGTNWYMNYNLGSYAFDASWLIFNDKIYIFPLTSNYYFVQKEQGLNEWVKIDTEYYISSPIVYNNAIHFWDSYDHYSSSDGVNWAEVSGETVPDGLGSVIVKKGNELHFFYSSQFVSDEPETVQTHYKYLNGVYTLVESSLPIGDSFLNGAFSINDKIYLLGHSESFNYSDSFVPDLYSWDGTEWTKEEDFPTSAGFNPYSLAVSDNKLYTISKSGWGDSFVVNKLYVYDGIRWKEYVINGLSFADRGNEYSWHLISLEDNNMILFYRNEDLYLLNVMNYFS